MKRFPHLALMLALILALPAQMPSVASAEGAAYISAPYATDGEFTGPRTYLDPVYYENDGGPTIGVTLVGVIQQDGLYFKDSDNDRELDPFEDWRLSAEERAADLVSKMNARQRIGLIANQAICNPPASLAQDAYNADGSVNFDALMNVTENALEATGDADARNNSTGEMLYHESRSGIVRVVCDPESGALWNNATNMVAEYAAVAKGEPAVPFMILSNPQTDERTPGTLGQAAAVIGATPEEDDCSLIERWADVDRQLWYARGIDGMCGPQIDLITDPRWCRNRSTYTELPDVMGNIATALVRGYRDGEGEGGVSLALKHFPGDSASVNGFESQSKRGEWRAYSLPNSLENYHLVAFQAAIDAGVTGIITCFSRPNAALSVPQSYYGVELPLEESGGAYNQTELQVLLRETMGFNGYVNSDTGAISGMCWGAEDMSLPERYAAAINAGVDVITDSTEGIDFDSIYEAYNIGLIDEAAIRRATTDRVTILLRQGQFENPYRDPKAAAALGEELTENDIPELSWEFHHRSVVLMKNHDGALPLRDASGKVFVASFTDFGADSASVDAFKTAFEAAGFATVDDAAEADIAFLDVVPGGVNFMTPYMNVLDLVEDLEVTAYDPTLPLSDARTDGVSSVTTLRNVDGIAEIAETVHVNGGVVIASIDISSPWILTRLEPFVDGLIASFSTSVEARVDVLTGAYNPTGHLPVSLVSCDEVIAVHETEIDGVPYEICASPNDVPGYDKDHYIAPEVLALSPSGSYVYRDADGNLYSARFGLSY